MQLKNEIIQIPKECLELSEKSFNLNYSNVAKKSSFGANREFNISRIEFRYNQLNKYFGTLEGKKILEIGSGNGIFVAYLRKMGIEAYGIEPDENLSESAKVLFRQNDLPISCIKKGVGEKIDYPNNTFDFVISYQVLEHVGNVSNVFMEVKRVMKNDGLIFFVVPNYFSFWEGHYGVFWFPLFNKKIAKIYLTLLGRNPNFIDTLNFITPYKIKCACKKFNLEIVSMGKEEWENNLSKSELKTYWSSSSFLIRIIKLIRVLKIYSIISWFGKSTDTYYPIYLIAKK